MRVKLAPLFVVLSVLVTSALARGNGAVFGGSGQNILPLKNDAIAMRKEIVEMIEAPDHNIDVRCSFWFVNHGDSATIQMGFPTSAFADRIALDPSFRAWVDGDSAHYEEGSYTARWHEWQRKPTAKAVFLWPVSFAKGQERKIDVAYRISWSDADRTEYGTSVDYILTTGAFWREPIGEADITFQFADSFPIVALDARPLGFHFDGRSLHWHRENFLPDENISIAYNREVRDKFKSRFHEALTVDSTSDYSWDRRLAVLEYWGGPGGEEPDPLDGLGREAPIPDSARADLLVRYGGHAASIRNEIYARHGYRFQSVELASTFHRASWYSPRDDFNEGDLNEIEQMNILACKAFEEVFKRATTKKDLRARIRAFEEQYW
jgi:hypothetical protein